MNNLAVCYENGRGVPIDLSLAVQHYQKAADLGNNYAMNNLATCYERGHGVKTDLNKAMQLYQKAANLGNSYAMNNLAVCYENGRGVPIDLSLAVQHYQKAADLGNNYAMYNLASCYENGRGVKTDLDKAMQLLICAFRIDPKTSFSSLFTTMKTLNTFEQIRLLQRALDQHVGQANEQLQQLCWHYLPLNLMECYHTRQRQQKIDRWIYTQWMLQTLPVLGDHYLYRIIGNLVFRDYSDL
jgi:hypothetical protein